MKPSVLVRPLVSSLIAALALTVTAVAQDQPVINVNNVEGLYAAVNNPRNAGTIVVLASGTYTLTATDPNNQPRPNGGHLLLQSGMALVGQNKYVDFDGDGVWDPRDDNNDGVPDNDPVRGLIFADPAGETIINAINLSGVPGAIPGAVRGGLDNRVERLTVRNTNNINAGIDINLPNTIIGGMYAEIRDCLVEDGRRGIRLISGVQQSGFNSSAVLERNILRRNTGAFGFGVQITIQGTSTSNTSWDVILRNNLSYANRWGLFVAGEVASDSQFHVLSMRNLYRENELGVRIDDGRDGGSGNNTQFTSIDDRILDNVLPAGGGGSGGGVRAHAGFNPDATAPRSSNNALNLQFIGTTWRGNFQGTTRQDLQVYGALALGGWPGTNDTARVLIRHGTSDGAPGAFQFIDSQPGDPTNTDTVTIIGSNVAFIHTNVGIDPPPQEHFPHEDSPDESN